VSSENQNMICTSGVYAWGIEGFIPLVPNLIKYVIPAVWRWPWHWSEC